MNTRFLSLLLLFVFKTSVAQDQYPNVTHPDPVSAEFQKYLGYPVSYATGIPQINIPLYTMNASGISIPFSLSYHASGIKVDQNMGSIGYGWSMFPGFKITRTIRGRPDDEFPTNDIRSLTSYDWQTDNTLISNSMNNPNFVPDSYFEYLYKITPRKKDDDMFGATTTYSADPADTQHDIFTIHLPNVNATFILEWVGTELKATTIPESPIKIEVIGMDSYGRFTSFEVTDESGIVYKFGVSEINNKSNNNEHYEYDEDSEAVTSWLVKEIVPLGMNNKITFNYNTPFDVGYQSDLSPTVTFIDEMNGNTSLYTHGSPGEWAQFPIINSNSTVSFPRMFSIKSLASISYETGEIISFNYSTATNRYDALDNITFKNSDNFTVKTIDFERSNKQLTKLTVSGNGAYEFIYDEQDVSAPNGMYSGKDYLGLFNGEFSNISSIPKMNLYFDTHIGSITSHEIGNLNPTFDPIKSQARILKNIIYPTGGQTSFEYEPNMYETVSEGVVCGMGLRIKKINTYDPLTNKSISKNYKYGENESGIGYCTLPNILYDGDYASAYITTQHMAAIDSPNANPPGSYRYRTVSSDAKSSTTTEPIIWYDQVTEYSNGGKTIFDFEFTNSDYWMHTDGGGGVNSYHTSVDGYDIYFPDVLRNLGGAPRLKRKEIKDANNNTLQIINNQYSNDLRLVKNIFARVNTTLVSGIDGNAESLLNYTPLGGGSITYTGKYNFLKGDNYWVEIKNNRLTSTTQTDYLDGEEVVNQTNYVYDNTYKFNLKSKIVTTSDGGTLTEKYFYPVGDAIPDLSAMTTAQQSMVSTFATSKNYQGRVIEKEVYKNTLLLNKELYGFKDWGNTIYKPENVYTKKGTSAFRSLYTIEGYDNKGNILDVSKEDGPHTYYVWGYKKQYPVAKIENFESSQVTSTIQTKIDAVITASDADNDRTIGASGNEGALRSALTDLKNVLPDTAMFTSYTYDPLIGITSVTDSKDYIMYYDYDTDNKLEVIKDKAGKIINDYEYHYVPFGTYDPIAIPAYSGDSNCGGGQTLIPN